MTDNKEVKYETKEEFVKIMGGYRGWSARNFIKKMDDFLYDYDIDSKYIFDGEEEYRKLQLNKEYNGLFHVLAKAYDKDIFIRDKQFSFRDNPWKDISSYYEEVSKGIDEELNCEQRYDIMNSYPYINMIRELEGIRKINEKITELKIALGMVNSSVRADVFEEMYGCIDTLIFQVYNKKVLAEEEDEKQLSEIAKETINTISMRSMLPENENKTYKEILTDYDLIKIQKFEQIKEEREKNKYIGEYLLDKLKDQMERGNYSTCFKSHMEIKKEKESIKDKIEEYHVFKNQTNEVIKRVMRMNDEQVIQLHCDKKSSLIEELEDHINRIKDEYNEFETMEVISRDIIDYMDSENHEKLKEYGQQLEPRSYYEGYLKFVEEISKFKDSRDTQNKKKK